jgi:hypothetical protein
MEWHIAEISTALPIFSTMPETMVILPTLVDVGRVAQFEISKMADCKPEVDCISGMECHIAEIPTASPTFSIMPVVMVTLPTLPDVDRLAKFKMADTKPEIVLSSGMEWHITEIPTALPTFSTMPVLMVTVPTLSDVGRLAHFTMADCKPEVDCFSGMEWQIAEIPTVLLTYSTTTVLMMTLPTQPDVGQPAHIKLVDCEPEVHCISVMEVHCISVNAESLFAVVTVTKLISVAIVRTLTTDDSAVMFVYDYDIYNSLNKTTCVYIFIMAGNVGSVTIDLDKVENVRVAVGNSAICNSIPEIYSISGLVFAILNSASRPTSHNLGIATIGSGMVENVGKAVGIRWYVIPFLRYSLLPVYSPPFCIF